MNQVGVALQCLPGGFSLKATQQTDSSEEMLIWVGEKGIFLFCKRTQSSPFSPDFYPVENAVKTVRVDAP